MRLRSGLQGIVSCTVVAAVLLAGCAPPAGLAAKPPAGPATPLVTRAPAAPAPTATVSSTSAPISSGPRYGGILTTAMYADVPSFDIHQENTFLTQGMVQAAYNNIVQYDPYDPEKIIGDLAEKWDASADGLTYTFYLRKGVKFHDGVPLTAEDAKISLERIYNPPRGVLSPLRDTLRAVDSIEVPDANTLRIKLKFQHAAFLDAMACGQIGVYPRHVLDAKGHMKNTVVGTGPFQYKDYASGVFFELVKNPEYFVKGRPYLDGIRFYIVRDDAARLAAFRTAQIKFMGPVVSSSGIKTSQARLIEKEMPQAKVYRFNALSSKWLDMVTNKPPFSDIRLRQAASLAIDRQLAIKVLLEGEGEIGAQFAPSQWSIPKDELANRPGYRQPKDADIAQAKKLMAEAGYANGLKTRILARANYTEDVAVFVKDQLGKIGIELEIVVKESSVFLSLLDQLIYETVSQPMGLRTADPDYLARFYHSQGSTPWMGLSDKLIDDLLARQASAVDPAQRKKLLREMEERLMEIAPNVILFWSYGLMASWPEMMNYKPGVSVYNNNRYAEVWLAK